MVAAASARQPVVLLSALSFIIVAATIVSAWLCSGNLYGGRSTFHVWWYGWVTAISTGLGALPLLFLKQKGVGEWWLGASNAVAGGMMTAASYALVEEGLGLSPIPNQQQLTPVQGVSLGVLVGVLFIFVSGKLLSGSDDAKFAILEGVDVRRALLIILVMTVHSFSEGIGIGT
jgi:ZIP family zinc transporter